MSGYLGPASLICPSSKLKVFPPSPTPTMAVVGEADLCTCGGGLVAAVGLCSCPVLSTPHCISALMKVRAAHHVQVACAFTLFWRPHSIHSPHSCPLTLLPSSLCSASICLYSGPHPSVKGQAVSPLAGDGHQPFAFQTVRTEPEFILEC